MLRDFDWRMRLQLGAAECTPWLAGLNMPQPGGI
jgi:hypothetical protein